MSATTHSAIVIDAKIDRIMAAIADLENYPKWAPGVKEAAVIEWDKDERPKEARLVLDAGPIHDTQHFVYDWSKKNEVHWWQTQGETLKSLRGSYKLERLGHKETKVTYELTIELALPMISTLQRRAEKQIVRTALTRLKKYVELQD